MARKKKSQNASELVSELNKWVYSNKLTLNPGLRKLTEDLESQANLAMWADIEWENFIPKPMTEKSDQTWRRINLLSTFRNIVVFSPVALTWASISVATSALARYEKENPDSVTNFLQFWQQGFGYLNDFWILSNVAMLDVGLVAIIIFLTSLIGILSKKAIEDEIIEQQKIDINRSSLILSLQQYFYEFKSPTVAQINRNTYMATKSLNSTVKNLSNLVGRLERQIKKYPDNKKLINEVKKVEKAISKIRNK